MFITVACQIRSWLLNLVHLIKRPPDWKTITFSFGVSFAIWPLNVQMFMLTFYFHMIATSLACLLFPLLYICLPSPMFPLCESLTSFSIKIYLSLPKPPHLLHIHLYPPHCVTSLSADKQSLLRYLQD